LIKIFSNIDFNGLVKLGKNTGGYFITSIINNTLPIILLPILTSFLLPEDYANITLFTAYWAIVNALTGAAVNSYIANLFFDNPKELVAKVIGSSIIVLGVLSIFSLLIIVGIYLISSNILGLPLFWLVLIPIASFTYILFQIGLGVMRNNSNVFKFSVHQIGNTIINSLISITLVVVIMIGWEGRVIGISFSYILSAIFAIVYLSKNQLISFNGDSSQKKDILKFIITLIPNSLQSVLVSRIGIFFMQIYFTKEILGIYSVGYNISYSLMMLVVTLNLSWSPFFYQQLSKKKEMNGVYVVRMFYAHMIIVLMGLIGLNLLSSVIVHFLTTEAYYASSLFIPWISLGFLFNAVVVFLTPLFINKNMQKYLSYFSTSNLLMMLILNYLLSGIYGYMGVAYAFMLSYFLMFLMMFVLLVVKKDDLNMPWIKAVKFF